MYIPTIILTIIVLGLGLYMAHQTEKHKDEIRKLTDSLNEKHRLELSEQKERLENRHKEEIIKANELISKAKDGTIIPELENEIKKLEKECHDFSKNPKAETALEKQIDDTHYWFITEIIMSLEDYTRNNDSIFYSPHHILDFALYFILITYLDIKKQVGFKQAVVFFDKANENLEAVYGKDIPNGMMAQIFHHRYSIYNSLISHYKSDTTKKLKIRETLASFLYFDNKLEYSIEYESYADEEYDEDVLTDYFPELIPNISLEQKEEAFTYIDTIKSFALDQEQLNEIIELLKQL